MKLLKILLFIVLIIFAFFLGIIFRDIPNITLSHEVKLFEPLSFLLTLTIGILIPFFIKRWIDDNRQIKNNLVEELKDTLKEVSIVKAKIQTCFFNGKIGQNDKDEINILFEQSDIKLNSLMEQLIEIFDAETKSKRVEINDEYMAYWKLVTGGEIMSSKFKVIDNNYYQRHNVSFSKFETIIKKTIYQIHRL